jgi:hypothetical protein
LNIGTGFTIPLSVFGEKESVVVDTSGNIFVGGAFSAYNGTTVSNFVKLSSTGTLKNC